MPALVFFLLLFPPAVPQEALPDAAALLPAAQQAVDGGRLREATALLEQLLEKDENHRLARQALVDVLMRQARRDEALAHLLALRVRFPRDPEIALLAAAVWFHLADFVQARQMADEALALDPRLVQARKTAALSSYFLSDGEAFEHHIQAWAAVEPRNAEPRYHLGRYHYEQKNFPLASEALGASVRLDPHHYRARYYLGWCHQVRGDYEAAEAEYKSAVEIVEKSGVHYGWPFVDLGEMLILKGRAEEGLGWIYRGLRNDPRLAYAHFKYAAALLRSEITPEIEQHLKTAIQLDPQYAEAHYVLGRYYVRIGERALADQAFETFRELRKKAGAAPAPQDPPKTH